MRKFSLIGAAALLLASSVHANVIAGSASGTISNSTYDNFGLFGPANANLQGNPISITYSYNTADFPTGGPGNGPFNTTPSTYSGSGLITVTINGKTQTYTPTETTEVGFHEYSSSFFEEVDFNAGISGAEIGISTASSVAFGEPVTPTLNNSSDIDSAFLVTDEGTESYITFEPTEGTSSLPEPSPTVLVAMALGIACIFIRPKPRQATTASAASNV